MFKTEALLLLVFFNWSFTGSATGIVKHILLFVALPLFSSVATPTPKKSTQNSNSLFAIFFIFDYYGHIKAGMPEEVSAMEDAGVKLSDITSIGRIDAKNKYRLLKMALPTEN